MLSGRVDFNLEAVVPIEVVGSNGQHYSTEAVLDTGFDGYLSLPADIIQRLMLEPEPPVIVTLADGQQVGWRAWDGQVLWHGHVRNILILESDETPLLGMELLEGSQLTIQVRIGGNVLIEELGGPN